MTTWNAIASPPGTGQLVFLAHSTAIWPGWLLDAGGYGMFDPAIRAEKQGQSLNWKHGAWPGALSAVPTHWYPLPSTYPPAADPAYTWVSVSSLPGLGQYVFVGTANRCWISWRDGNNQNWSWGILPRQFELRGIWLEGRWPVASVDQVPTHWCASPDTFP